jgi:hypothetical protein
VLLDKGRWASTPCTRQPEVHEHLLCVDDPLQKARVHKSTTCSRYEVKFVHGSRWIAPFAHRAWIQLELPIDPDAYVDLGEEFNSVFHLHVLAVLTKNGTQALGKPGQYAPLQ